MDSRRGRFGVAVAAALAMVVTGCGGGDGRDDGSGEGTKPSSPTRAPSGAGGSDGAGTRPSEAERPASPTTSDADDRDSAPDAPAESDSGDSTGGSGPADGTDLGACFDGRCEIAVSEPMSIDVDRRFGVGDLRVTKVTDDTVVLRSSGAGTLLSSSIGEGATGGLNGLGFRVRSLEGGTAVLEFFPRA